MNNLLLFIAALLVLALSALFAAPYIVDWNEHRAIFEQQVSRVIGRTVNVGGDVSLTFLPTPYLRFESINVADKAGQFDTPFLSARSVTVSLAVAPLLRGVIEARDVRLDEPVVNLRIDAAGQGNWQDVGRAGASFPFVPRSVELNSLTISDASVTIERDTGGAALVLEKLNGELSARSLQGPYKFAGHFQTGEKTRQLRFSTGRAEPNGSMSLKAVLKDDGGEATYLLDGRLSGVSSVPAFAGQVQALFGKPELQPAAAAGENAGEQPGGGVGAAPVEVKANVKAGPKRTELREVEITVRRGNKPQTIRGRIDLGYEETATVEGELTSRWVDLDSMTGAGTLREQADAGPARIAGKAAARLLEWSKLTAQGKLGLTFEQAVLAGDILHDVRAELASSGANITVSEFFAKLPGENLLSLEGKLNEQDNAPAFTGRLRLTGSKLNRLLGWGGLDSRPVVAKQEGSFSLRGNLTVGPDQIALDEVTGEMLGSHFSGAIRRGTGDADSLVLTLKSDRLDISRLAGPQMQKISLPGLYRMFRGDNKSGETESSRSWFGGGDAQIDVNIDEITLPELGKAAVEAGLHVSGSDIDVRRLTLRSDKGLTLQGGGTLSGLDATPTGSITLAATADSPEAVAALGALLELDGFLAGEEERLKLLAPARFAASVSSYGEGKTGLKGQMEGNLGGSELSFDFLLDGSPSKWTEVRLNTSLRVANKDGKILLRQLFPRLNGDDLEEFGTGGGALELAAQGVADPGLDTKIMLTAAGLKWQTKGRTTFEGNEAAFDGKTQVSLPDAAFLLRLANARAAPGRQRQPARISAQLAASKSVYEFRQLVARTDGETFKGSGRMDLSQDRPYLSFDLDASAAALPALLEPAVDWDGGERTGATFVRGVTGTKGYWPEQTIDARFLGSFDGSLKLTARKLRLIGGVVLDDATLETGLEHGVLKISRLEGGLAGGQFSASAALSAQGSGLQFNGQGSVKKLRLERLAGGKERKPLATGPVDIELSLEGTGLSANGVAAGLNGSGQLSFGGGEIMRLAPSTPRLAIAELNRNARTGPVDGERLDAVIARQLDTSKFIYEPFDANIDIRHGVARIENVVLDNPKGRASVSTFIELASLKLDSEWELAADRDAGEDAPKLSLIFTGLVSDIGTIKPEIDSRALQSYLTIRRMERDVERLEKLKVPKPKVEKPAEKPKRRPEPEPAPQPQARVPGEPAPDPPQSGEPASTPPGTSADPEPPKQLHSRPDAVTSRPLPPAAPQSPSPQLQTPQPSPQPWPVPDGQTPLPWFGPTGPSQASPPAGAAVGAVPPSQPPLPVPQPPPITSGPAQPLPQQEPAQQEPVQQKPRNSFRNRDVFQSSGD